MNNAACKHSKGPGKFFPADNRAWLLMRFAQARTFALDYLYQLRRANPEEREQLGRYAREWGQKARAYFTEATAPSTRHASA